MQEDAPAQPDFECDPRTQTTPGAESQQSASNEGNGNHPTAGCLAFRAALTAAGMDLDGSSFLTNAHTEMVSHSGCSLFLKHALAVDDEVDIRVGDREVRARVAGKLSSQSDSHLYAMEFDEPGAVRWEISIPDDGQQADTLALRCSACDLAGDVDLRGIAALVFETCGTVIRTCPRCCERTRWGRERGATYQGPRKRLAPSVPLPEQAQQHYAVAERNAVVPLAGRIGNSQAGTAGPRGRKSSRVQLKGTKACVQDVHGVADVVVVVDMSKSGLRFQSCRQYRRGDYVRVAAPYMVAGNNIFVAAEIVRIQQQGFATTPGEYALTFRSA
jgi:hypothetical protein